MTRMCDYSCSALNPISDCDTFVLWAADKQGAVVQQVLRDVVFSNDLANVIGGRVWAHRQEARFLRCGVGRCRRLWAIAKGGRGSTPQN